MLESRPMSNEYRIVKLSLAVGVLLVGISSCYYFMFALPKIQNQRLAMQVNAAKWEREQQCSTRAEHFFNGSSWSEKNTGAWYENHFNSRLNRCYILVNSRTSQGNSVFLYRVLMDVNDGKDIARYSKEVPYGKADYEGKPFVCALLEKFCQTDEDFDAFVKSYMED